ncbi:O-antigen ligase family protein [bacterium]|nr:O-antigen ligase family protein [candidate division CSSED10-310 bacterium]
MNISGKLAVLLFMELILTAGIWFIDGFYHFPETLLMMGFCTIPFFFSGNWLKDNRITSRICLILLISGSSLSMIRQFPERALAIWVLAPCVAFFISRAFSKGLYPAAYAVGFLAFSSAPYTELHLERDPWTLILIFLCACSLTEKMTLNRHITIPLSLMTLFVLLASIGITYSVYPYSTFKQVSHLLLIWLILILFADIFKKREALHHFMDFFLFLAAAFALAAFFVGIERIVHMGFWRGLQFRIFVFSRHPNYVIYPMLLSVPVYALAIYRTNLTVKRVLYACGVCMSVFYLLIYSYSRESWIILVFYFLYGITLFFRHIPRKWLAWGVLSVVCASSLFLGIFRSLALRIFSIFSITENTRVNAWKVFFDLIIDNKWIGYGLGTNRYIYPKALGSIAPPESPTRQFLVEAHNAFVDIAVGMGLLGLIAFILFLFSILYPSLKSRTLESKFFRILGFGLILDLFFNYRLHAHDTGIWFITVAVMTLSVGFIDMDRRMNNSKITISHSVIVILALCVILLSGLPWIGKTFLQRGQAATEKKDWRTSLYWFQMASLVEPLNAHPHLMKAYCWEELSNPSQAFTEYEKCIIKNPNFAFYRHEFAVHLASNGNFNEAVNQINVAVDLEPYDSEGKYRFLSGVINASLGNTQQAKLNLWHALLKNPDLLNQSYWNSNSQILHDLVADHLNFFSFISLQAGSINKFKIELSHISRIIETAGNPLWLNGFYTNILRIFPSRGDLMLEIARYYIRINQYDKAEKLLLESLLTRDTRLQQYNLLGYVYLLKKDYKNAQEILERGVAEWHHLSLDNIQGYQMLEKIYEITGQTEKLISVRKKLSYLLNGQIDTQEKDLMIHIGKDRMKFELPQME